MSEEDFEQAAEIFKAMSNKTRLQILSGLIQDECNVKKIVERLHVPQSTISQQLSVLRNKGIIKGRREGTKICYRVIDKKVKAIMLLIQK